MTDCHNHLIPGVDDGASDVEEAAAALRALAGQGVEAIICTPHMNGSQTLRSEVSTRRLEEIDGGLVALRDLSARASSSMRIEQGVELMLDVPHPDVADPRVRLAGSRFVLVEFAGRMVPPGAAVALFELAVRTLQPIIAHPERYASVQANPAVVDEWLRMGCLLQVNSGSLVGDYGAAAQRAALDLLRNGRVSYIASDFHARGDPSFSAARNLLLEMGAHEHAEVLMSANPSRILADAAPHEVPPLVTRKRWWSRLLS